MEFVVKNGPIFNIVHNLINNEGNFGNEDDYSEDIETCCYETTEMLKELFSSNEENNEFVACNKLFSDGKKCDFDINQDQLLIVELNDVAEGGSHYMVIIKFNDGSHLIQSSEFRYRCVSTKYLATTEILMLLQEMMGEENPLRKIEMYNTITHNRITMKEYNVLLDPRWKRNESLEIEAYPLVLPSREKILKYLNKGLNIANQVGFVNIAKRIQNTISDLLS